MKKRLLVIMVTAMMCWTACGKVLEDSVKDESVHSTPINSDKTETDEDETYVVITDRVITATTTTEATTTETTSSKTATMTFAKATSKKAETTTTSTMTTTAMTTSLTTTMPSTILMTTTSEVTKAGTTTNNTTTTMTTIVTTANQTETATVELTAPPMPTETVEEELTAPNLEECIGWEEEDVEELTPPSFEEWSTTIQETTEPQTTTAPEEVELKIENVPQEVIDVIKEQQRKYPHMQIAVGFFALDGTRGYVYNGNIKLFGACTIKAAYACFVLMECKRRGINIEKYKIEYIPSDNKRGGSGDIATSKNPKQFYTAKELLSKLISISDNTAYSILTNEFAMSDFKDWLRSIGGATKFKNELFSYCNVEERYNEWMAIYKFEQEDNEYAKYLKQLLRTAQAYYLGVGKYSEQQHKSGWTENDDGNMYTACDCGIVNGKYILVILTRDDFAEAPNANHVRAIGRAVNSYVENNNLF